jgi:hypothetical protein
MSATTNLAREIQAHVPHQPWGRNGNDPVDVELWYDAGKGDRAWRVRFVVALKGGRRVYETAGGRTVEAALEAARKAQLARGPS